MNASDSVNALEATVASVASKATSGGATASVIGFLTSNEGIALVGLMITIVGFVVNLIFKFRQDRRDQEFHRARLAGLVAGTPPTGE